MVFPAEISTRLYKEYKEETPEETEARRNEICRNCKCWSVREQLCNYIIIYGRIRPCHASLCVEKGIFEPVGKDEKRNICYRFNGSHMDRGEIK